MKESIDFLKKLDITSEYIIIGCSGGPDSMCLLDLLIKNKYKPVVAHVNHNIREESVEEYNILKEYCDKNKIIFEGLELEKNNQSEAFYRKKRYTFYKKIADKYNTKYILTAHHADDLIETILMRLSRGSNIRGYAGFPIIYNEYNYVFLKPLLFYTKEEILNYNKACGIKYFIDRTNAEDNYTRNRYRHNVLTFLKKENPKIHKKYLTYSNELNEAADYINDIVENNMNKCFDGDVLLLDEFNKNHKYIQKSILRKKLSLLYGDDIEKISSKHLEIIMSLLKKEGNFSYDLPGKYKLVKSYNKVYFVTVSGSSEYSINLENDVTLPNGDKIIFMDKINENSNYVIKLSIDDVKLPLIVRTRKNGDKIYIKNLNGSKKVNDVFIDSKIDVISRNTWPIITDSNDNILWIPGLRKSKFDIPNEKKYDIILKYIRKEEKNEKK